MYPILVHRPANSFHASFPRFVTASQLRFPSLTVTSLREDLHLLECAHAGRTKKPGGNRVSSNTGRQLTTARLCHKLRRCEQLKYGASALASKRNISQQAVLHALVFVGFISKSNSPQRMGSAVNSALPEPTVFSKPTRRARLKARIVNLAMAGRISSADAQRALVAARFVSA